MSVIRLATPEDAAAIAAIYAPYVRDTTISFEAEPPDADAMRARMTSLHHAWLVLEDREVLGYAYAAPHRTRAAYAWTVESSVYLDLAARGRGLGRRLYAALFALLAAQGYRSVLAGVTLPNAASVALHEGMGFRPVGVYPHVGYKFGRWHDVAWWSLDLGGPELPRPPKAIAEIDPAVFAPAPPEPR